MGAAERACIGLCVEATVERILIFLLAARTHLKSAHGGARTIVRHTFDDRETRTTIRAVCEWVVVAPVLRGEQLLPAVLARRDIRGDERVFAFREPAVTDLESSVSCRWRIAHIDALDARGRRCLAPQTGQEIAQCAVIPFNLDIDSAGMIQNPASQSVFVRQAVHERTETHTLNHPLHQDVLT